MGTSGLVGQFNAIAVMGLEAWPVVLLMHFLLPALITLLFSTIMRRKAGSRKVICCLHCDNISQDIRKPNNSVTECWAFFCLQIRSEVEFEAHR